MFPHAIRLGKFLGIEIRIDPSWIVIALLVGWSLYVQFGAANPSLRPAPLLLLSVFSVILFFGSVLLHELSHSTVARRFGIPVEGITLFLFGGVSTTKMEAKHPRDELWMAIAGPAMSLVLAGVMWLVVNATGDLLSAPVRYAAGYLGWLNFALGLFNLLPGYPLDGGRVLRSILWARTGSITKATRGAARGGRFIGSGLIGLGLLEVFFGDLSGLWLAAIGWFLLQAATAAYQDVTLHAILRKVRARDLMSPDPIRIPWDATLEEAVANYFLHYDHSSFAVDLEGGTGLISLRSVRQVPREQWNRRQVWTVASPAEETCIVAPDTPMDQVVDRLRELEEDRVLVAEAGQVLGIITPRDITRWVQRFRELGLVDSPD
jgi:Zn-dependent protease/predicted transcriptional regulator